MFKQWFVWGGIVLAAGTVPSALPGSSRDAASAADVGQPIVQYSKLRELQGDYRYTAYQDRLVIRDNSTGREETVRVDRPGYQVAERFQSLLEQDSTLSERLGAALTDEVSLFEGALQVQVFEGGAMLYEAASRTTWWGWHRRRIVQVTEGAGPVEVAGGSGEEAPTFRLDGPSASHLLAAEYPRKNLAIRMRLRYSQPGVLLDTVGINAAPVGSFHVTLGEDGRITVGVYDPTRESAHRAANGWHLLTASSALSPGETHTVEVALGGPVLAVRVDGGEEETLDLATPLSGEPIWVGDFPGDDGWGPRYRIHPALTGEVQVLFLGSRSEAPPPPPPSGSGIPLGEVIAEGKVGPAGGRVEAPGRMVLDFPAGALTRTEKIVVRTVPNSPLPGNLYWVEREGGHRLFPRPVKVTLAVPPGTAPDEVFPVQEVHGPMWAVLPGHYDAASGRLTTEVLHFSGLGWASLKKWAVGTVVVTVGGIVLLGGASTVGWVVLPAKVGWVLAVKTIATVGVGGALVANEVNAVIQEYGLDKSIEIPGLRVLWTQEGKHAVRCNQVGSALLARGSGTPLYWYNEPVRETDLSEELQRQCYIQHYPQGIINLLLEFSVARSYYERAGYKVPETVTVLVHRALEIKQGDRDAGCWDGDFFHLNADSVEKNDPTTAIQRQATVAHELWHAISEQNGYQKSRFPWLDECLATAMESQVFPGTDDYLNLHPWSLVAPVLESGFVSPGPQEDAVKRGYELWPWGKFLLHTQGHQELRQLASGHLDGDLLLSLFVNFTRSLLTREQALPDPVEQTPSNYPTLPDPPQCSTGWKNLDLQTMISKQNYLGLGRCDIPMARPLSFRLLQVAIPKRDPQQPAGPLVIRRQEIDRAEQVVALRPPPPGKRNIQQDRTLDDLIIGDGGVEVEKEWADSGTGSVYLPVALVGKFLEERPGRIPVPLLIYRLVPPAKVKISLLPSGNGGERKVEWEPPFLGSRLRPSDGLAGYRLLGRTARGEVKVLAELLFDLPTAPAGWYRGEESLRISIKPDQTSAVVPLERASEYVALGLASVEALLRAADGSPLVSEPTWQTDQPGEIAGTVYKDKEEVQIGAVNPFSTLEGEAIPDLEVVCTYTWQGKTERRTARTDKYGAFRFTGLPLEVEIQVSARGKTQSVTCTAEKPRAFVVFGWAGHEIKVEHQVSTDSGE